MSDTLTGKSINPEKKRNSSIELFRIITMFIIVAHHYVINSGLMDVIIENGMMKPKSIFLLLFGWGGKTGINCFVLITGYFMCKSNITLKKFLKLVLEVEFYRVVIYLIFLISGYSEFSVKALIKTILPVTAIESNFTGCYIVFFLFIPFLNILVRNMNHKQHMLLLSLCILFYTVLPSFKVISVTFNYVGWFMIIYLTGAYIRLYPNAFFDSKKLTGLAALICLLLSWCSVIAGAWLAENFGMNLYYHFVSDSNKILAFATAVAAFLFFKNIKIKYNRVINTVAASAFGVLLIHAHSDDMRKWLWQDVLNNVGQYDSSFLILHAFGAVIGIYLVCTIIDMFRIMLIEKPLFKIFDNKSETS